MQSIQLTNTTLHLVPGATYHKIAIKFLESKAAIQYKLTRAQKTIIRVIAKYSDMSYRVAIIKQSTLAKDCNLSLAHVNRTLKQLVQKGFIKAKRRWKLFVYNLGDVILDFYKIYLENHAPKNVTQPTSDAKMSYDTGQKSHRTIEHAFKALEKEKALYTKAVVDNFEKHKSEEQEPEANSQSNGKSVCQGVSPIFAQGSSSVLTPDTRLDGYDAFVATYPRMVENEEELKRAWKRNHCCSYWQEIIANVREHRRTDWSTRLIQFVPKAINFITRRMWKEPINYQKICRKISRQHTSIARRCNNPADMLLQPTDHKNTNYQASQATPTNPDTAPNPALQAQLAQLCNNLEIPQSTLRSQVTSPGHKSNSHRRPFLISPSNDHTKYIPLREHVAKSAPEGCNSFKRTSGFPQYLREQVRRILATSAAQDKKVARQALFPSPKSPHFVLPKEESSYKGES